MVVHKTITRVVPLFAFAFFSTTYGYKAVTQEIAGGRLGDQIISYLHAKWVSYKYQLPLYYQPFPYSDQLVLHDQEMRYQDVPQHLYKKTLVRGQTLDQFINPFENNVLYAIPYFPESKEEYLPTQGPTKGWQRPTNIFVDFPVDWHDKKFKKIIQKMVAPKYPINLVQPPKNKISVAIQVRKNSGGYDLPLLNGLAEKDFNPDQVYVDVVFPLKHPPDAYYIEQLKKVIGMFPDREFYVFIFTDDPQPLAVMNAIKAGISDKNVEFACRTTENNHHSNVLEDLFSMTIFDCLVRPDSNLSIVAARLGDFKVTIAPKHHHWEERKLVIDEVVIEYGDQTT